MAACWHAVQEVIGRIDGDEAKVFILSINYACAANGSGCTKIRQKVIVQYGRLVIGPLFTVDIQRWAGFRYFTAWCRYRYTSPTKYTLMDTHTEIYSISGVSFIHFCYNVTTLVTVLRCSKEYKTLIYSLGYILFGCRQNSIGGKGHLRPKIKKWSGISRKINDTEMMLIERIFCKPGLKQKNKEGFGIYANRKYLY